MEEFLVFDESVKVSDTIEETSGDLSCHFTVNILNREKDRVTDELGLVSSVNELREFTEVNLRESNLSSLGIGLLLLLRSHHVVGREVVLVHDRLVVSTLVSSTLVTSSSLLVASTSVVVVATVLVLVVSTVLVSVLVIETTLEHLLIRLGLVVGSNDPLFFT